MFMSYVIMNISNFGKLAMVKLNKTIYSILLHKSVLESETLFSFQRNCCK